MTNDGLPLLVRPEVARSSSWPSLEHHFLQTNDHCAVCGGKDHLQVHHKLPFHLRPDLELDPKNLVTLCQTPERLCHLRIGHGGSFEAYNPDVAQMVIVAGGRARQFDRLVLEAQKVRRYTLHAHEEHGE